MATLSAGKACTVVTFLDVSIVFNWKDDACEGRVLEHPSSHNEDVDNADGTFPVICTSLSQTGEYFICCIHKNLHLWRTKDWKLLSTRQVNRSASAAIFAPKEDLIAVADKSGDVFLYSVECPEKGGELIMGHVSMLLDILITDNSKYVITSDRDEKIRVSSYPNAYNIQSYCLGHEECVTSLCILPHNEDILVSGSGDGTLRFWEYEFGRQIFSYICRESGSSLEENKTVVSRIAALKCSETDSALCVQLVDFKGILVYNITSKSNKEINCNFKHIINLESEPWCLCFSGDRMWVLKQNVEHCISSYIFCYKKNQFIFDDSLNSIQTILGNHTVLLESVFKKGRDLNTLYKRRFDNVQEYLKRKVVRLESDAKKSKNLFPTSEIP